MTKTDRPADAAPPHSINENPADESAAPVQSAKPGPDGDTTIDGSPSAPPTDTAAESDRLRLLPVADPAELEADPPWLGSYPAEHRGVLRKHGFDLAVHEAAHACNARLIEKAAKSATDEELDKLTDDLAREWILEEEAPEIELPDAFYDLVEERIEDSIEERRRQRRDDTSS